MGKLHYYRMTPADYQAYVYYRVHSAFVQTLLLVCSCVPRFTLLSLT